MKLPSFLQLKPKKKFNIGSVENNDFESQRHIVSGTKRNYSALKTNDVAIKIWLPEVVKTAMNEVCFYVDTTHSDLVRQTLFMYLYGRYDLIATIERGEHDFALNQLPRFSRSAAPENSSRVTQNRTPELGKNMFDVKVWISKKMKNDLTILAENSGLSLSVFTREILISNLFGHSYLPERNKLISMQVEFENEEPEIKEQS